MHMEVGEAGFKIMAVKAHNALMGEDPTLGRLNCTNEGHSVE